VLLSTSQNEDSEADVLAPEAVPSCVRIKPYLRSAQQDFERGIKRDCKILRTEVGRSLGLS
jgi:hypothetical protein